jgi:hypothetical protein
MAFTRSSEPFQEPPQHGSRRLLAAGVVTLLVFFVPLLVIIARNQGHAPAQTASASPTLPPPPRRMPPLPPPGASWPPPPGAPVPPVCVLEYRDGPDGTTTWTAMTTRSGELAVTASAPASAPAKGSHPYELRVPISVETIALPAALARDHGLHAVLTTGDSRVDCLVGPQA